MSDDPITLNFSMEDSVEGKPLTPGNVDLPTLRGFLGEVEKLIKGDMAGASLNDSRVWIEEGSLKVVTVVGVLLARNLLADLSNLEKTRDLDSIQAKRAQVLETWWRRTRDRDTRRYALGETGREHPFQISRATQLTRGGDAAWVRVEKYLEGKVVDIGGKQEPNVHLELANGRGSVRVNASENKLRDERENQLYKQATLRVSAEQHLVSGNLRNLELIEFVKVSRTVDEEGLARLWDKGRSAWKGIASATAWVDEMRSTG